MAGNTPLLRLTGLWARTSEKGTTYVADGRPAMSAIVTNLRNQVDAEPPRQPMCNHEVEQHLLGALLTDNSAFHRVQHIVEAVDFAWGVHGRIFAAIAGQIRAGRQANPVTLGHAFANDPAAPRGGRYLMELARDAITVSGVADYAVVVADLRIRREVIAQMEEFCPGETALNVLERLRPHIEAFANAIGRASNGEFDWMGGPPTPKPTPKAGPPTKTKQPNGEATDDLGDPPPRVRDPDIPMGAPPDEDGGLFELMADFNQRYAVVNEAGKVWVFEWRADPVMKRAVLDHISFADFRRMYQNRRLTITAPRGKGITKTVADCWLEHPGRRQFLGGVVFDPTDQAPAQCWNLWRGFAVKPQPGDWSLMRKHISDVIAAGIQSDADYILDWLALLFQQPQTRCEVALAFRGDEGIGKGILCTYVIRAFGQHGIPISNAKHLIGNFNAHLRDCVALFADEAFYAGDKQHEGILKALITEPFLAIEAKFQNVATVPNMLHLMMASNADWIVPVSIKGRRFAVFDVADKHQGDRQYFKDVGAQMETGGLSAMIWDLPHRDISQFEVRDLPKTNALADQKRHSLDSLHRWWLAVLSRGFVWKSRHGASAFKEWQNFYTSELLHRSYIQWCEANRPFDRKSREQMGVMMADIYQARRPRGEYPVYELDNVDVDPIEKKGDWLDKHSIVYVDHPRGFFLGTLEEARARFTDMRDVLPEWRQSAYEGEEGCERVAAVETPKLVQAVRAPHPLSH
jgi:hypothetical protein